MDKSVIINGFIHQLFTKNEIVTDAECLDILHTYFKLPLYTIAAFAPDTKNNNGSYQHDVISFIPGYASGCRDCIVWFYRTENHELLLIFNHNEDFNIKNCITGIHNYFSKRYNCRTLWGISRPCGNEIYQLNIINFQVVLIIDSFLICFFTQIRKPYVLTVW